MVRLFIYCLLALAVGVLLSIELAENPGYVLVSFRGYSVEATLVTTLIVLSILFFVLFGGWWLLKAINPFKLFKKSTWSTLFGKGGAKSATEKGLRLLLLGQWQASYKLLVENAHKVQVPSFNYLAASLAAFQRGDRLSWVYCLDQAEKNSVEAAPGIKSLKGLLELKSGQLDKSLAILSELRKKNPDSPYILVLLKDVYVAMGDWLQLEEILPALEKSKLLQEAELLSLAEKVALFNLGKISASEEADIEIAAVWNKIPKKIKSSEAVVVLYIRKLLEVSKDEEATVVLSRYLRQHWSDEAVELLGRVESKDAGAQLLLLEGLVKDRPNNIVLMLSLGRLSLRNQLWGKAKEYFETGSRLSKSSQLSAEINAEMARLLESMGEPEASLEYYKKAMGLLDRKLPDLPMPIKVR